MSILKLKKREYERWLIFALVTAFILIPILTGIRLNPAPMETSKAFFSKIEELSPQDGKVVLISLDWGTGTLAENKPQSKLVIEHLFRKRIPFALVTLYPLASPFLEKLPLEVLEELKKEIPSQNWEYGKDWVNLGYLPNGALQLQSLVKSKNWTSDKNFKTDANNVPTTQIPIMSKLKSINDVSALVEITGLTGVFSTWLQYFQTEEYTPIFLHGCTSITIPEAFIFYSSGQLKGFFEGIAGAAHYESLISETNPQRKIDFAKLLNTGNSFAQILVILLIVIGNILLLISKKVED
jgi:hypothetical protein